MNRRDPILRMTGIHKAFVGVKALDDVDFRLFPGEVHALMGENGAGKSTLIKVLTGVHEIDAGEITLAGSPVLFGSPMEAQHGGVSTVYQEVNLCANLSVAENIFLGREPRRLGRIQWRAMRRGAAEALKRVHLRIDVTAPLSDYSLAVQQMVAIARAVDIDARVLILDEPTSSLDKGEVEELFTIMRKLKAEGIAIVFVSHFLDQVYAVSDRMTILRNGQRVGEWTTAELNQGELVSKMLGREAETLDALEERPMRPVELLEHATPVARAEQAGRSGAIEPFDLAIHPGEVVGLAGLLGSGRTELARLFFGADHADHGKVLASGKATPIKNPRVAMTQGIGFSPENRRTEGLVGELTIRENIVLAMQAARGWTKPIPRKRQDELVAKWIEALDIRPAKPEQVVSTLSGGNQQKVLLARWLITEPKLLILDEPTRGIDVGAKAQIQKLVAKLSDEGMSVLFVSAELEEVLRLSHKVTVLRDRQVVAELPNDDSLTVDRLVATIASGGAQS
jgi:galactofuranose transport system ATP-binding protein